jgi:uncharacterized Zn finger protein (UPF0148 family)
MSAQCPRCGTALKDDYGMTQCPNCSVFAFVDMDGKATINTLEEDEPAAEFGAPEIEIESLDGESIQEPLSEIKEETAINPPDEFLPVEFQIPGMEEALPDLAEPPSLAEVEAVEILPDLGPDDDPLGISDFANSEVSSGKFGPFLFKILILGIDTKEIRESIREALEDSRFGWDPDQVLSRLDKGRLTIENLAPVKATIIIHRLRHLPVKIRWEQYAISQIEPN